jgi:hypothetical protein
VNDLTDFEGLSTFYFNLNKQILSRFFIKLLFNLFSHHKKKIVLSKMF